MVSEEMAFHEATHAVLAVHLDLPFEKVSAVPIQCKDPDGSKKIIAAGIIGNMGGVKNSPQIRIVALAGCVGQVFHEWPRLVAAWEQLKKPQQTKRDRIISRLPEHKKDMQAYEENSNSGTIADFDGDLDKAIEYVGVNLPEIERVARELRSKGILSREEVVNLIG